MDINLADLEAFNGSSYADELGESSYADEQLGESSYADEQLGESSYADEPFDEQFTLTGSELALADVDTGCWGAALNGTSQCCSPGFVIGKGHLKKKFCPNCIEHGFFVDARRVRAIDEASHDEFANARGAGLWTTVRTHDQEDHQYRVVNQTHLCRGPRLLVFAGEPPHSSAWAPWAAGDFVVDGFVHLRLGLGTLVPTKAAARATPAAAPPMLMPPTAPSAVALLAAHEHLAHLAAATMAEPAHLGDDERLAIADLLPRLTTSTAALRRACGGEAAAATSGAIVATMAEPPHLEGPRAPRFTWSAELHMQFEAAVAELGVDRATPQAIARLMGCVDGDGGPTRQNIKSHLQKYRLAIRKREEAAARVGPPAPFTAVATASGMAAGGGGPPHLPIAIATATFPVDDAPPPPPPSALIFSFPPSAPGTERPSSRSGSPFGSYAGSLAGSHRSLPQLPPYRSRLTTTTPVGSDKGSGHLPPHLLPGSQPATPGATAPQWRGRKGMTTAGLAFVYFLILLVCSGLAHSLSEKVVLPFAVAHAGSSTLAVVVLGWVGSLVVWVSLFLAFVLTGRRTGVLASGGASGAKVGVEPPPPAPPTAAQASALNRVRGKWSVPADPEARRREQTGVPNADYPHRGALFAFLIVILLIASFGGVYAVVEPRLRLTAENNIVIEPAPSAKFGA